MSEGSVLITGGTGFIASHLARKIVKQGCKVVLFDLYPNRESIRDIEDQVEVVSGDVVDHQSLLDTLENFNVDSVIHTAAMLSVAAADELTKA
ncbi:MAG: NAD-dependent epimerase/dehydratase family protein, partial [Candidatus Thorarchaeota archaeon]